MRAAIERLNPDLPPSAVREALSAATTPASREAFAENRLAHGMLTRGIRSITYTDTYGAEHTPTIRLVDLRDPDANTYHAVASGGRGGRGVPAALRRRPVHQRPTDGRGGAEERLGGEATLKDAHAQLRTYLDEFPLAFRYTVLCLVSDVITAKYGTPFTPYEHFAPWNVDEQGQRVDTAAPDYDGVEALFAALHGLFTQDRFLALTENFVNFTPPANGSPSRTSTSR